ncbi:unnamed protein product [Ixodes pacificus]
MHKAEILTKTEPWRTVQLNPYRRLSLRLVLQQSHGIENSAYCVTAQTLRSFPVENAGLAAGRILLHFSAGTMLIMLSKSGSKKSIICEGKSLTRTSFTSSGSPTKRIGFPPS